MPSGTLNMFKRNVFDSLFLFLGLDPKEIIREVHKDSHCNILPTANPGNNPVRQADVSSHFTHEVTKAQRG